MEFNSGFKELRSASMPSLVMPTLVLRCQYIFSFDTFIRHSKFLCPLHLRSTANGGLS